MKEHGILSGEVEPRGRVPLGEDVRTIVVMGVSGSGKSAVGQALASVLESRFEDGDDHHSPANIERIRSGFPLSDDDRTPWLERLAGLLREAVTNGERLVLACSALKSRYRDLLRNADPGVAFVHLDVPRDILEYRQHSRVHFFPPHLLDTQLGDLEPPRNAVWVDGTLPVAEISKRVARLFSTDASRERA